MYLCIILCAANDYYYTEIMFTITKLVYANLARSMWGI